MNDLTDKPLHDWVRQQLSDHEAMADPQDIAQNWQLLRPRLFPHRWRPLLWLWGLGLLGLLGSLSWYWLEGNSAKKSPVVAQNTVFVEKKPLGLPTMMPQLLAVLSEEKNHHKATRQPQAPTQQVIEATQPTPQMSAVLATPVVAVSGQKPAGVQLMVGVSRVKIPVYSWPVVANRAMSPQEQALEEKLLSGQFGPDSTVFASLTRNLRSWPSAVIVCDLTTSMDPYAAQIYAWFRRNAKNPQVQGVVFFTDCDSLGQQTRPNGPPGASFVTRERDPRAALPTLLAAARNTTNNRDGDENVVEALRYAQRTFPQSKHLILLADNSSGVKDMSLLAGVKKPVHVIACGSTFNDALAFQDDHYQIALKTGGTVHTLEDDFAPADVPKNTFVRIGEHIYRYSTRKGRFVKTRFERRPVVVFGVRL